MEYLGKLCEVDVDELCLEIETHERKEVSLLDLNQLIVALHTNTGTMCCHTPTINSHRLYNIPFKNSPSVDDCLLLKPVVYIIF